MANGIDFQPVTLTAEPPPPESPPPAPIDFQPVTPAAPSLPTIQPSAVSVESAIPRYTPEQQAVIDRIKSGRQDYTFGPGSPGATKEDLETFVGGKHSPASGFAVHGGVALPASEYNLFSPEQRRQLGIMDIAPEDQRGKVERYYDARAGGRRQSFGQAEAAAPPTNIAGAQNLEGLTPSFKDKIQRWADFVQKETGYTPKIISGHRSIEEQAKLYERYKRGGPLAAPPGRSYHNFGSATDISFIDPSGKTITDEENANLFRAMHKSAEAFGIKGIGESDLPHFQDAAYAKVSDIPEGVRQAPAGGVQVAAAGGGPPSGEEIRARIAEITEQSGVTAAKGKGIPPTWKPPPPPKKIPVGPPPPGPTPGTATDESGVVQAQLAAPGEVTPVLGPAHPAAAIDFQANAGQAPAAPAPPPLLARPTELDFQPLAGQQINPAGVIEPGGVAPPLLAAPEGPFPKAVPVTPGGIVGPTGMPYATAPADQTYPVPAPVVAGNIDINNRPVVQNPDGSVSTELSFSIGTDQGEVLIPQVVNGKIVSKEAAIQHYKQTGEHLGIFKTPAEADAYAGVLHQRQHEIHGPERVIQFEPLSQAEQAAAARAAGEEFRVSTGARAPMFPEGSPEHAAILRAHAGDLSRPPGMFARQSTIEEAVAAGLPRVVPGELRGPGQLTEAERLGAVPAPGGPPMAPPSGEPRTIGEAFNQGGILGALFGDLPVAKISPELLGVIGHYYMPTAAAAVDSMQKAFPATKPAVEGLTASAAETLTGLTTPSNVLILGGMMLAPQIGLPAWVSRAASLGFSAQAAHGMWENAKQLSEEPGSAEWWKSFGNVIVQGAFAATAGAHGLKGAKGALEPAEFKRTTAIADLRRQLERGNISMETYKARLDAVEGTEAPPPPPAPTPPAPVAPETVPAGEPAPKAPSEAPAAGERAPAVPLLVQDTTIPANTRYKIQEDLKAIGHTDEEIAAMTTAEAQAKLAAPSIKAIFSAKGATNELYKKAFAALQKGETTISGVKDPLLAQHRPAFDRGEIKSWEDLRTADQGKGVGAITPEAKARAAAAAAAPTPPLVLSAEPTLPTDLRGAKPRYNYGSKAFELEFESDLDKASYIAAQATKSRADARYVKFATDATGLSEAEIRSRGQKVRERIKAQAATAEPGRLRIAREGAAEKPGAPPVSEKPAAGADVAGTSSDAIAAKIKAAPEIEKQIDAIVRRGAERKAKAKDPSIVAQRPTEYDWLTGDELARIERLKAKLPTAGEQRVAAQGRLKAKRAARLAEETAAETKARLEHEREMEEQLESVGAENGPELIESVIAGGGLPAKGSKARAAWKGELDTLEEGVDQAIKDGRLPRSIKKKLFTADAPDLDRLATSLRDYGFETPRDTDVIDLVERRLTTDRPHYGQPARAAAEYGMGAAHINEPLASYEKRAFGDRLKQDRSLAEQLREQVGSYYEPISNKATLEEAVAEVDKMPVNQAVDQVLHNERLPFHVRSAMGQLLIKRLNAAHQTLTAAGDHVRADRVLDQAVDLAGWAEEFGTRLGQGVQSFAMWQRLTPEGQLRGVQKKVNEARRNYSEEHKAEIAELKAKILELQKQQLTDAERLAELKKLFGRNPTAKRVKPYLQKLLDATRSGKFTDEIFYNIVSERLGLPKFDRQTATQIMRLAFDVAKAPEGLPKDKATLALQHYIATRMGFAPKDLPLGIWYGNMLSGYNTQLVNTVDTLVNVLAETTGLAITNPRAMGKIYSNMLRGLSEGTADALVMWNNGRIRGTAGKYLEMPALMEVAQFGQKGGVPIIPQGRISRAMKAAAESKIALPLNYWKYVGRLMMASDSIMFRGARQAKAAALADHAARQEGLSGKALDRRVREMLGQTAEQYQDFAEQAKLEGFAGAERAARIMELRDRVQSAGASADAEDFAGVATYNHAPRGLLGKVATMAGQFGNIFPPFKLIVPFTRIVANVTNRSLNYSPWGFKRALYGYTFDKSPMLQSERAMHYTRAAMGTSAMFGALALQSAGVIEIHGNGPKDAERRRQLMQQGWKPYSVKVGDHYLSYLPTPLAITFGILGNMSDSFRYHEMDSKHGATAAVYALARTANVITSQSFLSGLSNFFSMVSAQPDQAVASWRNYVAQTASAVFPKIALDISRIFDPTKYDSNTLSEDLMRNTPFASITNRASLNAFGESTSLPRQRFVSAISKDLAWQIVNAQQLRVPVPDKYTKVPDGRGGLRQLTPQEYYDMLQETGPKVKEWILSHAILENVEPADAQDRLDKAAAEIRGPVLDRIKRSARWNPAD